MLMTCRIHLRKMYEQLKHLCFGTWKSAAKNFLCSCKRMQMRLIRFQLKRGLFLYRHHPKMHEMVSDRSLGAANWTGLRKMSMRIFLIRNNVEKGEDGRTKHKHVFFVKTNIWEATRAIPKLGKSIYPI